jgi:hypothetical protein
MSEALTRISAWDELVDHVRRTYKVADTAESTDLIVEAEGSTIQLRPFEVNGATWVEIVATVVKKLQHAPPVPILTRNFLIPIGTLALRDGSLLLRQLLPIVGLRTSDLAEVIEIMSDTIIEGRAKEA